MNKTLTLAATLAATLAVASSPLAALPAAEAKLRAALRPFDRSLRSKPELTTLTQKTLYVVASLDARLGGNVLRSKRYPDGSETFLSPVLRTEADRALYLAALELQEAAWAWYAAVRRAAMGDMADLSVD